MLTHSWVGDMVLAVYLGVNPLHDFIVRQILAWVGDLVLAVYQGVHSLNDFLVCQIITLDDLVLCLHLVKF